MDYYSLYANHLEQVTSVGGDEFKAICPYHDDTNPSLFFNQSNGLCNCFSCGISKNAPQFAKDMGIDNPNQYYEDNGYTSSNTLTKRVVKKKKKSPTPIDTDKVELYKSNFKNKWNELEYRQLWDELCIDGLDVGIDNNDVLHFAYHNENNKIVEYRQHRSATICGDTSVKWYLGEKLASYSKDKELYISEGEKDALSLYFKGIQVISSSNGCNSFPKEDIEDIASWRNTLYLPYDKDDSGLDGSKKLAQELLKINPNLVIKISKWNKDLPKGFDVYDSFMKDGGRSLEQSFVRETLYIPEQIGGFKLIKGTDIDNEVVEDVVEIVEALLPEHHNTLISGTTGSNKSTLAMNMAMSLANNEDSVLKFKINKKNLKVLYVDTEVGERTMLRRSQKIKRYLNWKEDSDTRFNMLSKKGMLENAIPTIREYLEALKPNILFIDCLYNITDGADTSKGHHLSPILNQIDGFKDDFDITICLVSHFNKGNHKEGLMIDRANGSSTLQNWLEHCVLMTKTNEKHLRLLKIGKTRDIDYPDGHFLIELHPEFKQFPILFNKGITDDWSKLLVTEQKNNKWNDVLEQLPTEFTTREFQDKCILISEVSDKTARNWLKDMVMHKIITKIKQGNYRKDNVTEIDTEDAF